MLEGAQGEQDFHNGFVEAAGRAATAAARGHMPPSGPSHQSAGLDGEAGQRDTAGSEALHDHCHCSEDTAQQDIQDPGSRVKTVCSLYKLFFGA